MSANHNFDYTEDILTMQANSYELRSNSWKHSIIKHSTAQSRILADNKDLPSKFSPAKFADSLVSNTSKSLVRFKVLSRSHDELALKDLKEVSASKEKYVQKKVTIDIPREMNEMHLLKGAESQESLTLKFDSPRKGELRRNSINNGSSLDVIREHKIEYLRFKERVLNELKKQEEAIKQAVRQIMHIINNSNGERLRSAQQGIEKIQGLQGLQGRTEIPQLPSFSSLSINVPKLNIPHHMVIDPSKYRESLTSSQVQIESVMPKIKERVSKMFDLMGQLKSEINDQSVNLLSYDRRLPASLQAQR